MSWVSEVTAGDNETYEGKEDDSRADLKAIEWLNIPVNSLDQSKTSTTQYAPAT